MTRAIFCVFLDPPQTIHQHALYRNMDPSALPLASGEHPFSSPTKAARADLLLLRAPSPDGSTTLQDRLSATRSTPPLVGYETPPGLPPGSEGTVNPAALLHHIAPLQEHHRMGLPTSNADASFATDQGNPHGAQPPLIDGAASVRQEAPSREHSQTAPPTSDADASFVSDCGTPRADVPFYMYTDPVLFRHLCSDATGGEGLSPKQLPSSPPALRKTAMESSPSRTPVLDLAGDVGGGYASKLLPPPSHSPTSLEAIAPEETSALHEPVAGSGGPESALQPHDSPLSLPYRTVGVPPSHLPPLRPALDIPSAEPRRRNAMDNDSERSVPYQKSPPRYKWTFWKPGRYCYYHRTISDVARWRYRVSLLGFTNANMSAR